MRYADDNWVSRQILERSATDQELLEQLLICFVDKDEARRIAAALLDRRGSLRYLCEMPLNQLRLVEGLPENAAFLLANLLNVITAARISEWRGVPLTCAKNACDYFAANLALMTRERCLLVALNERMLPFLSQSLGGGSVDHTALTPAAVLAFALRSGANALLMGHNHPGGTASPSLADIEVTHSLIEALRDAGAPLIDHILVANGEGISMRALSVIPEEEWLFRAPAVPPAGRWLH